MGLIPVVIRHPSPSPEITLTVLTFEFAPLLGTCMAAVFATLFATIVATVRDS